MRIQFYATLILTLSTQYYMASNHSFGESPLSTHTSCTDAENDVVTNLRCGKNTKNALFPSSPLTPVHPNNGFPTSAMVDEQRIIQAKYAKILMREITSFIQNANSATLHPKSTRTLLAEISMHLINKVFDKESMSLIDQDKVILQKIITDEQYCIQHMPKILKELLWLYDHEEGFWFSIITATAEDLSYHYNYRSHL